MKHREYFYTDPENISQGTVDIKGEEFRHLSRVLRKKERDVIDVVDGRGNLYTIVLTKISRESAQGEIQKRVRFAGEPNFHLTLAQAIPKGNRFDLVIEKGTEIGVSIFMPIICANSIGEGATSRVARWKKIAIAAMKQSARSVLPEILPPQPVHEIIQKKGILKIGFIADDRSGAKSLTNLGIILKNKLAQQKSAIILIGPEGGLTPDEVNLAVKNDFHCFTLGQRRLRSETAGIVASAILMELIGEMG